MILTPVAPERLPALLDRFAGMVGTGMAGEVFRRIARPPDPERAAGARAAAHHRDALRLAGSFGIALHPGAPSEDFSWDGRALRSDTEAYVLLHEVAHFQLAARRHRIDFGLGPGPETGRREEAERAAMLHGLAREREEAMASLLGILWEAELGHPALASFLEQNWLEGAERPSAAAHFLGILAALRDGGFLTDDGRPTRRLREVPDAPEP
jgi:hypothetical protein